MSIEQLKAHRYPGVKPFSENERHVFYGRANDTKKLYQLIQLEKLVLLYSKSGLGKSSLLNAGVLPLFEEAERYSVIRIRLGAATEQSLSPVTTCLFKLPETTSNEVLDKLGAGGDTLWLRIKALQYNNGDLPITYILVFDQFEELFTYNPEEIRQFKKQLADLLYAKMPAYISKSVTNRLKENPDFLSGTALEYLHHQPAVKVVVSIRSDRMSLLNTLADYLPDIQKNYYELKPLERDAAIESIVKPALDNTAPYLSPTFAYSIDCIHKILDYLTQNGQKSIETFQLQTICQYVENLAIDHQLAYDQQKQTLLAEPAQLGDLQNIFRTQYDKLIGNIDPAEKQLAARLLIENKLIIDGNRVSLPDVVVLKEKGIDKTLIAYLHDTHHLLRSEPNTTGGISYELSHDTLVAPILRAKKEREDKEELIRLEAERQEELRQQNEKAAREKLELAKTRKRLRVVYSLFIAALLALGAAAFFGFTATQAQKKAEMLKAKAERHKTIADSLSEQEKNKAWEALRQSKKADSSAREADSSRKLLAEYLKKVIGAKYHGGIVFGWTDKTGNHGLIAAEKDLPGTYTWDSAVLVCKKLKLNGYQDWRLPTKDELNTLYSNRSVVGDFGDGNYWCSLEQGNKKENAWLQHFDSQGERSYDYKKYRIYVRPVRSF